MVHIILQTLVFDLKQLSISSLLRLSVALNIFFKEIFSRFKSELVVAYHVKIWRKENFNVFGFPKASPLTACIK